MNPIYLFEIYSFIFIFYECSKYKCYIILWKIHTPLVSSCLTHFLNIYECNIIEMHASNSMRRRVILFEAILNSDVIQYTMYTKWI